MENLGVPKTPESREIRKETNAKVRCTGRGGVTDESWGPLEHAEPNTPDSIERKQLERFGHHHSQTPPSLGKEKRRNQDQESGKPGEQIPDTPHTQISGSPRTPSEGSSMQEEEIAPTLEDWIEALTQAVADTLEEIPASCKKYYMKRQTWNRIEEGNRKLEEGDKDKQVHKLNKEIKKNIREDKKEKLNEQFRENKEDLHKKHLWKTVNNLKGEFAPKYIQMRNRNGMPVPLKKRAEAIAEHLEQEHWTNALTEGESRRINKRVLKEND